MIGLNCMVYWFFFMVLFLGLVFVLGGFGLVVFWLFEGVVCGLILVGVGVYLIGVLVVIGMGNVLMNYCFDLIDG